MRPVHKLFIAVAAVVSVLACGSATSKATATIASKSGSTTVGTATFTQEGAITTLKLELTGVATTNGKVASHIHAVGDCSDDTGAKAGGHWNPKMANHGKMGPAAHHSGDIGNIDIDANGKGSITLSTDEWTINADPHAGTNNVVGHAIIVHGGVDDYVSQPAGDAGSRAGCGVIEFVQ